MTTLAIIQARMSSSRLPGKVLQEIGQHSMLWHVVERTRQARRVEGVKVATSVLASDDPIAEFCRQNNIPFFRGSEDDVLDRYYQAARHFGASTIVRITADCPLMDPEVIDKIVDQFQQGGYDYVTNTLRYTYPNGLDVEVFSFAALERAWKEATASAHREHVTDYIRTAPNFRLGNVENKEDLSRFQYRWTVDHPQDLRFVREVYQALGGGEKLFKMADILELLRIRPDLLQINQHIIRHEGYYLSILREEQAILPSVEPGPKSRELLARAGTVLPVRPNPSETWNVFIDHGLGGHVWDVDGNEFIDYDLAQGKVILGHGNPEVTEAVREQLQQGSCFSWLHRMEVELAEKLSTLIPCAEKVCFSRTESEAVACAIQSARHFTGRAKIACCPDKYLPVLNGTESLSFSENDLAGLELLFQEHTGQIAAVLLEPVGKAEPQVSFLSQVKGLANRNGALLVFDETATGFRPALGGAQKYLEVMPDLSCFGTSLANGFSLAALVGNSDIVSAGYDSYFHFVDVDVSGLAAALATIRVLQSKPVIGHLWELGQKLKDGYNVMARELGLMEFTHCGGLPPCSTLHFSDHGVISASAKRSLVCQELACRGVLIHDGFQLCLAHTESDIDHTLRAIRATLEFLAKTLGLV